MPKIWIAEDDTTIKEELFLLLYNNGYTPVESPSCDLALLDINLPDKNGFALCRELRERENTPVIFLTARDTPEDELLAFGVGADDFIRKPYHSSVLLARIARLLHRNDHTTLRGKGLTLDTVNLTVTHEGHRAELTRNESLLLSTLLSHELCTKELLIGTLWDNSLYVDENTLYVNMARLREKLRDLGVDNAIRTVRGVGYRL